MREDLTCSQCGIVYGVPSRWLECRREDRATFWCPNGHTQMFSTSRADKLAAELSRERQCVARLEDEVRQERKRAEEAERRSSAARGQVTRLKKRAAAGVCPCCNRTFANLARHMAGQHPGFVAEPVDGNEAAIERGTS